MGYKEVLFKIRSMNDNNSVYEPYPTKPSRSHAYIIWSTSHMESDWGVNPCNFCVQKKGDSGEYALWEKHSSD